MGRSATAWQSRLPGIGERTTIIARLVQQFWSTLAGYLSSEMIVKGSPVFRAQKARKPDSLHLSASGSFFPTRTYMALRK